jgi:hypothetical protein
LHFAKLMENRENASPGWAYYAAVVLFVGVLAFAILGLVRSSSLAGASTRSRSGAPRSSAMPTPAGIRLSTGRIPTPQIPPPSPVAPTELPSRTYLYPAPERR